MWKFNRHLLFQSVLPALSRKKIELIMPADLSDPVMREGVKEMDRTVRSINDQLIRLLELSELLGIPMPNNLPYTPRH